MNNLMHKWLCVCASLVLMLSIGTAAICEGTDAQTPGEATPSEAREKADWTVMLYLCGTDLESRGGMVTYNLTEISETIPCDAVNVVFETGGTRDWSAAKEELGLEIAVEKLQRWTYDENGFVMVQEQPIANMADGRTLTDFIRWAAESYPAEKYMLLLWDHGGGSLSGLILDELHGGAIMSLEDMSNALKDSGVHFEAVALDTCLMAGLETAQAVQESANYLIAAEETVPGYGTAYREWLQYLYDYPYVNGKQLGRYFCDAVQTKYAELNNEYSSMFLTFSAIDLSKLDAVSEAFDAMFAEIRDLLADPEAFGAFAYMTRNTDSYSGTGMIDLMDMARRASKYGLSTRTAGAVIESVGEAVVSNVKGLYHSYSQGLAFWYAPTARAAYLDHYARSCKSAQYLAFLDEVNMGWTAPSWVYEQVERRPDISREGYTVEYELSKTEDGHLQLTITNGVKALAAVDYQLLKAVDKEANQWVLLGRDYNVLGDFATGIFRENFDGMWPTLDGALCCMDMIDSNGSYSLYDIPIGQLQNAKHPEYGYNIGTLRAGYVYDPKPDTQTTETAQQPSEDEAAGTEEAGTEAAADETGAEAAEADGAISGHYELYGVWTGMDNNIEMPGRDVQPLDVLYGETMTTLCPDYDPITLSTGSSVALGKVTFGENTAIQMKTLPKGTYAYEFVITDVFGKKITTMYVPFTWDGQKADFRVDDANEMRESYYMMQGVAR